MKILHTSDWHIGRTLYRQKRYEEFDAFLSWLADIINQEQIDTLLVAGDIFDTTTPSNRAQELYYNFLCKAITSPCRHVVIIAGNHDSPSFLNAPKDILRSLNIHVVCSANRLTEQSNNLSVSTISIESNLDASNLNSDIKQKQEQDKVSEIDINNQVLVLKNKEGSPELIVCAVPYLRDREIRVAEAGETIEDKDRKLIQGIRGHYYEVCNQAQHLREKMGHHIPLVVMGHLFTAGGKTTDGDGVRELYVGSLAHVPSGIFPDYVDYVALGHLHVPQKVADSEFIRYSGSPIAMSFGEATQQKSICIFEFNPNAQNSVKLINVPVFQPLIRITGNWGKISSKIKEIASEKIFSEEIPLPQNISIQNRVWIEVVYDGDELIGDLRERLEEAVIGTNIEILRVQNNRITDRSLSQSHDDEMLIELNVNDVFVRCLDAHNVPEEQRSDLIHTYQEVTISIDEEDRRAE